MSDTFEFVDIGSDDPNVIGMRVHGKVSADAITQLVERLQAILDSGGKARLYVNLCEYEGYDLPMVREKLANLGTIWSGIERCGYVMDKAWMSAMINLVDAVTPMHLKAFSSDEDDQARAWVLGTSE